MGERRHAGGGDGRRRRSSRRHSEDEDKSYHERRSSSKRQSHRRHSESEDESYYERRNGSERQSHRRHFESEDESYYERRNGSKRQSHRGTSGNERDAYYERRGQSSRQNSRPQQTPSFSSSSGESYYEMEPVRSSQKSHQDRPRKLPTQVKRSCTDVLFIPVFVIVVSAWGLLAFGASRVVDPRTLVVGKDSENYSCGIGNAGERPYLYVFDYKQCFNVGIKNLLPLLNCDGTTKVCVKECPSENRVFAGNLSETDVDKAVCTQAGWKVIEGAEDKVGTLEELVNDGSCANHVVASKNLLSFCVPNVLLSSAGNSSAKPQEDLHRSVADAKGVIGLLAGVTWDLWNSYWYIFGGFGIALVLSFVWLVLMQFVAKLVIWTSLLLSVVVFGGCYSFACYRAYHTYLTDPSITVDTNRWNDAGYLATRWLVWAVLAAVFGLLFILDVMILAFLRKRLRIAAALIVEASRLISTMPSLTLFPIFPYLLQALGLATAVTMALLTASLVGAATSKDDVLLKMCHDELGVPQDRPVDEQNTLLDIKQRVCAGLVAVLSHNVVVHLFNVFAALWSLAFVNAFGFFVTSHAVAKRFWTRELKGAPMLAALRSAGVAVCYHMGSLAFGSLILAIVGFFKLLIQFVQGNLNKTSSNCCSRAIARCCVCFFWIFEKLLKFTNKNAYIMIAMYGKGFCRSAWKAFSLIVNNILRAVVLLRVTSFVLLLVQLGVAAVASAGVYFALTMPETKKLLSVPDLYSVWTPVSVIAVGSFAISSGFFNVYRDAIDTLFLCFLEDKKINDGSREKPYKMPKELLKILDKKNYRDRSNRTSY